MLRASAGGLGGAVLAGVASWGGMVLVAPSTSIDDAFAVIAAIALAGAVAGALLARRRARR